VADALFWWTGGIVWTLAAVLAIACGLPEGGTYKGVTLLTFYGFGPVIWRVTPENKATFERLREVGYHFLHIGGSWNLGFSLPTWLSRRLFPSTATPQGRASEQDEE
jgi:hypothetical protein